MLINVSLDTLKHAAKFRRPITEVTENKSTLTYFIFSHYNYYLVWMLWKEQCDLFGFFLKYQMSKHP